MSDCDGLAAFDAGFHYATHVVIAALLWRCSHRSGDLHSRDVIAESAWSTLHYPTDLIGQRLVTFYVRVGIDLDLHAIPLFYL
jgi:hypothetical protein